MALIENLIIKLSPEKEEAVPVSVTEVVTSVVVVVEIDVAVCFSPKYQRLRFTQTKKRKSNPLPRMIVLCLRKPSENEGGVSLGFIIESYQSVSGTVLTENESSTYHDSLLYYQLS